MPAKAKTLEKVAKKLGFQKVRQKGSHARWKHPDGAMQRGLGEAARSWGSPRRRNLITLSLYGW